MMNKERFSKIIKLTVIFSVIMFSSFCRQESSERTFEEADETVDVEFDVQKIVDSTGLVFNIFKTKEVGYEPLNKFFWVNVEEKLEEGKLKILAKEIINAVVENKPQTYHSFTIHFICSDKIRESKEKPESFAKVTYLPEGSWIMVGRVPIDDYNDYVLKCIVKNNMLE